MKLILKTPIWCKFNRILNEPWHGWRSTSQAVHETRARAEIDIQNHTTASPKLAKGGGGVGLSFTESAIRYWIWRCDQSSRRFLSPGSASTPSPPTPLPATPSLLLDSISETQPTSWLVIICEVGDMKRFGLQETLPPTIVSPAHSLLKYLPYLLIFLEKSV